QIRHELTEVLRAIPTSARHAARETLNDVGTEFGLPAESERADAWAVCAANLKRAEQALRSLEEFAKIADVECGGRFEALRYRLYTWERAFDLTRIGAERLRDLQLYVLVDGCDSDQHFERLVRSLIDAGVDALQLRDKRLSDRQLLVRARQLRSWTRPTRTLMIVNDRPDLARLSDADGVHVGKEDLEVRDIRRVTGPRMLIGVSTHSIEQVKEAVLEGANMIGVGPTFASTTKSFQSFPGLDLLRQVAKTTRLPAFAIGGIDVKNIDQVKKVGIRRVAVGAAVTASCDPPAAVKALREKLARP
ncbi:MAG: thiamine phosphate synthase, partial [Pirellulales bacterium]